ncbi:MAG: secondary thiamine-phosphate synthase enzyme YjbQ [Candidatus Diapherotrites archaeon]|nr:secondary thiamine-phosphate synthase enzyme YjbQ [Candidatus Diapherotrites archaeon]
MASELKRFSARTGRDISIINITEEVGNAVASSKIKDGIAVVFVAGSTAAISTLEFEPGLLKDLPKVLEKIAPLKADYEHHKTWNDRNGASHILSNLVGPSLTVPFEKKKLLLGSWQQIVLMDFDRDAREREVLVQVVG